MAKRKKKGTGLARDRRIMAERYAAIMRGAEDFYMAQKAAIKFLRYAKIRATEERAIGVASMARGSYDTREAAENLLNYIKSH